MLLGMVVFRECFSPSCLLQMTLKEPQMMTNFQNTKILQMQAFSVKPLKPGPLGEDYPITAFFETKRFISFWANFKFMTFIGPFAKKKNLRIFCFQKPLKLDNLLPSAPVRHEYWNIS